MSRVLVLAVVAVMSALTYLWLGKSRQTAPAHPTMGRTEQARFSEVKTSGAMLPTRDWFDFFRSQRREGDSDSDTGPVPRPESHQVDTPAVRPAVVTTYRTLCVRLCDGFSFPISYSTRRDRFARDAKRCEESCPSGARLFIHRQPGQEADEMADLQGRRYRDLPTAFLHRNKFIANCTCRGNPWDEAALTRHRAYADAAKQGTKIKVAEKTPIPKPERRAARHSHVAQSASQSKREDDDD